MRSAAGPGAGQREQGGRQQLHGLERRERNQHHDGQRDAVEPVGADGRHRGHQRAPHGRSGAQRGQPGPEPGRGGRPPGDAGELGVVGLDPVQLRRGGTEGDQVGRGPKQRHHLGGEVGPGPGQECLGPPSGPRGHHRNGESRDEQRGQQHEGGRREQGGDQPHRDGGRGRGDRDRLQEAQRQVLHRVDVADQPGQQVPPAEGRETGRRQRLQVPVDVHPDPSEAAERDVVGDQPLEVAEGGAAQRERAHRDDGQRQHQQRRLQGGGRDQPGRCGHQRDHAEHSQHAEGQREEEARTVGSGQGDQPAHGGVGRRRLAAR